MYKYKMIMKKILLGLVMLVTAATMNAQIELEHVFDGSFLWGEYEYGVGKLTYLANAYVIYDNDMLKVYNEDYSLQASFLVGKYWESDFGFFARNIFTTDGTISLARVNYEENYVDIIKENGELVKRITCSANHSLFYMPYLVQIGGQYKLIVVEGFENGVEPDPDGGYRTVYAQKTYIYSCPGNGETTTSVENVPAKVKRNAYPNPASDLVTLPYEVDGATSMKIYDMQGKLVERKFLDESKQELQLNVKDYPSGMYFFEVNGESNSFIVE